MSRSRAARLAAVLLLCGLALHARAVEPVTVRVEGVVDVEGEGSPRDRAFSEALVEAVLAVSQGLLEDAEIAPAPAELRERLRPRAAAFVLTYRIDGPLRRRVSPEDGSSPQLVLPVSATVDASQLREHLADLGLLAAAAELPSVALWVRDANAGGGGPLSGASPALAPPPVAALERYLREQLTVQGVVVVEPALRASGMAPPRGALELGRQLGADVALDVAVTWRPRDTGSRVAGGVAEVQARALRVSDGAEIALARFEGAGYHEQAEEAFARAIDAVRAQVAQNVTLQLERNWQALAQEGGPVELWLLDVGSLVQVSAVREALEQTLGAVRADLRELGPRTATLEVEAPLSPGALQDRLAALAFPDFRLEPLRVQGGRVELRVEPLEAGPARPLADR